MLDFFLQIPVGGLEIHIGNAEGVVEHDAGQVRITVLIAQRQQLPAGFRGFLGNGKYLLLPALPPACPPFLPAGYSETGITALSMEWRFP